jgi:hypothetical protein
MTALARLTVHVFHPYHIFRWAFKKLRRIRPLENENIDCVETNNEGMS